MELIELDADDDLEVARTVEPKNFSELAHNQEAHLEELIIRRPNLLNIGGFKVGGANDLEIIAQQPITESRKRADLFALDQEGALVVIEVKRESRDQRSRNEGMNFQALRYAASARTMTADDVVELYADFLRDQREQEPIADGGEEFAKTTWRSQAIANLSEHFADEDEKLSESDVLDLIDPSEKQKIYLVAASFDEEVTATAAWLREHGIEVACFRLQPYELGGELYLNRERLIPPPELDQFYIGMKTGNEETSNSASSRKSDKPKELVWTRDGRKKESVNSWRETLQTSLRRLYDNGISYADLPSGLNAEHADRNEIPSDKMHISDDVYVQKYFSAQDVRRHLADTIEQLEGKIPDDFLIIKTNGGSSYLVPGERR